MSYDRHDPQALDLMRQMGMLSPEEEVEEAHRARQRAPIDVLAEAYGGRTRRERRAFKSNLKRLVRKEARKKNRQG